MLSDIFREYEMQGYSQGAGSRYLERQKFHGKFERYAPSTALDSLPYVLPPLASHLAFLAKHIIA